MKATIEEQNQRTAQNLVAFIASECREIDVDSRYDDMLDEYYSLESVGGPFAYMSASSVLRECDPIAYRCGKNDWLDSERDIITEVKGAYYDTSDVEQARDEFVANLETEASEIEEEMSELDEDDNDSLEILKSNLDALYAEIAFAQKYSF